MYVEAEIGLKQVNIRFTEEESLMVKRNVLC